MELNRALLVLVLAVPASAQIERGKFVSAAVDPGPVKMLAGRLAKDGERVEMKQGIGSSYTRVGKPDARGRFENLQVTLVEIPSEVAEAPDAGPIRPAVVRRYFSHLEAVSENWEVDPRTGAGTLHVWIYIVGLKGSLISVEHQTAPVETGADGRAWPVKEKASSDRLAPSDPDAQRRWKALTKELLTLGRLIEA